jgi:hypothetical protein
MFTDTTVNNNVIAKATAALIISLTEIVLIALILRVNYLFRRIPY